MNVGVAPAVASDRASLWGLLAASAPVAVLSSAPLSLGACEPPARVLAPSFPARTLLVLRV